MDCFIWKMVCLQLRLCKCDEMEPGSSAEILCRVRYLNSEVTAKITYHLLC